MINITKPANQYETELCQLKIYPSTTKMKDILKRNIKILKNKSTNNLDFTPNKRVHSMLNFFPSHLSRNKYTPIYKKTNTQIKTNLSKKDYFFSSQYSPNSKANINYMDVSFSPKIRPKSNINNFKKLKSTQINFINKNQNRSFHSAIKRKNTFEIDRKFSKYVSIMNNLKLKYHGSILLTKSKLNSFLFNQAMLINYKRNKFYQKNMFNMIQNKKSKENKSNNEIQKATNLFKNELIKNKMNESKNKSEFSLKGTFMNKNGEIEKIQKPKKIKIYNYKHLKNK